MSRALISYLLPFVPLVAYALWAYLARRKAGAAAAGTLPAWQAGPWSWLIAAALLAGAIGVLGLALVDGADPSAKYVPPSYKDGEVIPGHIE
ncbi:MAG: DUF6111 family protein [Alphaproteobacteria bacterium]